MSLISNMKATILRMGEMPFPMLTQLKAWLQRSFNGGDIDNSPSLRVAFATNENNEVVTYAPVQQVFLISHYAVNPTATEAEARRAGNEIDLLLEAEAR